MFELLLIGCGKMGNAILEGTLASGRFRAESIAVVEQNREITERIAREHPEVSLLDKPADAALCVVAVKPFAVPEVLQSLAGLRVGTVVSIAAGVKIATLEANLAPGIPVVRSIPNTPGQIGMGITAIATGSNVTLETAEKATQVLEALGEVVAVPEAQIDAITAISGSGPAYVYYFIEAMVDAAVELGLAAPLASRLAVSTFKGAAELLERRDNDTRLLRLEVSSPGGTTIAATNTFDRLGMRAAIVAGIRACFDKSVELGLK